ncbi:peptidylprolyl isomerase [Oleisolibacter albus]|uniref:peptidylprolyl isomerase n=1 Tax=Oleisolibacter albus TaxID=2171757 RepID=UPI00138FA7AB|nr:peptidylprolyl isomerase [Oleisolibacter albus]
MKSLLRSTLAGVTAAFLFAAYPAAAQQGDPAEGRIAAVVNEEAITMADVLARLRLALVSSGLPDTAEARQRLLPQVLRLLIDERLQIQEARQRTVSVSPDDVDDELNDLAKRNRMTMDQFKEALDKSGVPFSTIREQTIAHVAWSKLVQRAVRPSVVVADEEVNAYLERIKANAGKPEYLVSEIFIPVDKPTDEQQASQLADRLVDQIGQGANFQAVAQQFSQSAGAATGGDLGWIQQGQLEENLDRALQQLRPGQFSRPIRSVAGFHILWLRDQRAVSAGDPKEIQVSLRQFVLPVGNAQQAEAVMAAAKQVAEEASSCEALDAAAQRLPGAQTLAQPLTRIADLPAQIGQFVSSLGVGTPTPPMMTDHGAMILMVCDRVVPEGSLPPLDQVRNALFLERLDMQQRRYLRDLRRSATIEYRL